MRRSGCALGRSEALPSPLLYSNLPLPSSPRLYRSSLRSSLRPPPRCVLLIATHPPCSAHCKMDHTGLGVGTATQGSLGDDTNSTCGRIDSHGDCDTANANEADTAKQYSSDTARYSTIQMSGAVHRLARGGPVEALVVESKLGSAPLAPSEFC